jgi:hypothetical protein
MLVPISLHFASRVLDAFAKAWDSMLGQPLTDAKLENKSTSYDQMTN